MENSDNLHIEDSRLRVAAFVYDAVMLVGFVIGLYGFFSLCRLASAEIQHSARVIGFFY